MGYLIFNSKNPKKILTEYRVATLSKLFITVTALIKFEIYTTILTCQMDRPTLIVETFGLLCIE